MPSNKGDLLKFLLENTQDLNPDFSKSVDKHFWELSMPSNKGYKNFCFKGIGHICTWHPAADHDCEFHKDDDLRQCYYYELSFCQCEKAQEEVAK